MLGRLLRAFVQETLIVEEKKRRWPPPSWNWPPRKPYEIQHAVLDWFDRNGREWTPMAAYRRMRDEKVLDGSKHEQSEAIPYIEEELGYTGGE